MDRPGPVRRTAPLAVGDATDLGPFNALFGGSTTQQLPYQYDGAGQITGGQLVDAPSSRISGVSFEPIGPSPLAPAASPLSGMEWDRPWSGPTVGPGWRPVRLRPHQSESAYGLTNLKVPPKAWTPLPLPTVPAYEGAPDSTTGCSWP